MGSKRDWLVYIRRHYYQLIYFLIRTVIVSMNLEQILISRTAIEQYLRCAKCFYLQRRLGLKPLSSIPLTLAGATDVLLKNDFDIVRYNQTSHPLWDRENINVRAFKHPDIDTWRSAFRGIRVKHSSGAEVYGAIDDIWINCETNELHIVDYKSTSKKDTPTLDTSFGEAYKRQMEIYQWLFIKTGFPVSKIGYFLYVNGIKEGHFYKDGTIGSILFETNLIPYIGDTAWIDTKISDAVNCLSKDEHPKSSADCDTCRYYAQRNKLEI